MENTEFEVVEMEKELYIAAKKGNKEFLEQVECEDDEYLKRKTHDKNNIFHVAIRHEHHDFVEACLKKFSKENELIFEKNSKGNTPLHVATEVESFSIVKLLYGYLEKRIEEYGEGDRKPWRIQNWRGNTPLHVALLHDNVKIAKFLLEKDPYLAKIVNNSNEAPLHLAIKQQVTYSESKSVMASIRQSINEGGGATSLTIKSAPQEDMSKMIKLLVEKASSVTCWLDAEGLTPLHRVASLIAPYNIQLTKFILEHCPHSAEICDNTGKSILHLLITKIGNYQEAKNLLSFEEIYALRNYQDDQGNTPLHIAAKNMDKNILRVLLESSTKLYIYNADGISAASLIQQEDMLQLLWRRKLTRDEINATEKGDITYLREKMEDLGIDFLLSQGPKGRNIIHRLMVIKKNSRLKPDLFVNFIEEALGKFPSIISQTDGKGDTPIHVLVQNNPDTKIYVPSIVNQDNPNDKISDYEETSLWRSGLLQLLLEKCHQCILKFEKEASVKGRFDSPWLLKNEDDNSALHEAIKSNTSIELVKLLVNYNNNSLSAINKNKETPLHLFATHPIKQFTQEDLNEMVGKNDKAAFSLDENDLTPLLRAYKAGNYNVAAMLCNASPKAAETGDSKGQTYGHLLVKHQSKDYFSNLFQDKELRGLLKLKDVSGNTPLHLVINDERFDLVRVFLKFWKDERKSSKDENQWLLDLLDISNVAGLSPADLIGELLNLPNDIEKIIMDDTRMMGIRSAWGIPKKQLNSYISSMNVIAALLTTITFTAAFQVPGGLIQDKGTPQMIGDIAFQVFMIADVLAMCLSMMVLFCLLWIMATNNKRNSVMIQDFSVTLLIVAFFATLLAFMTGVYATTYSVKRWIAITTLIICSLLLVLVQRCIVLKLFIPISKAILIFDRMVLYPATKAFIVNVQSNVPSIRRRKVQDIENRHK